MTSSLRSLAKAVRTRLVRATHPWRRQRALRSLAAEPLPASLLFVCLGNVCRSPYAAVRFRQMLEQHAPDRSLEMGSGGFIKPGRGSPDQATRVANDRGVDLTGHVSRVLSDCSVDADTLVIVMEGGQVGGVQSAFGAGTRVLVLGDLDPEVPSRRLIPDPWGQPDEVFVASFDRIDRCLSELLPFVLGESEPRAGS